MSVLIEAEKLRRKLEKLDAKRDEEMRKVNEKHETKYADALNSVSPEVRAVLYTVMPQKEAAQ